MQNEVRLRYQQARSHSSTRDRNPDGNTEDNSERNTLKKKKRNQYQSTLMIKLSTIYATMPDLIDRSGVHDLERLCYARRIL